MATKEDLYKMRCERIVNESEAKTEQFFEEINRVVDNNQDLIRQKSDLDEEVGIKLRDLIFLFMGANIWCQREILKRADVEEMEVQWGDIVEDIGIDTDLDLS